VVFAGYGLLSGQTWARVVGIILASASALVNFAFIPYYPFWSLAIIALDVFVIWALATQARAFRL
jgi:type III secretory pathway component EscV